MEEKSTFQAFLRRYSRRGRGTRRASGALITTTPIAPAPVGRTAAIDNDKLAQYEENEAENTQLRPTPITKNHHLSASLSGSSTSPGRPGEGEPTDNFMPITGSVWHNPLLPLGTAPGLQGDPFIRGSTMKKRLPPADENGYEEEAGSQALEELSLPLLGGGGCGDDDDECDGADSKSEPRLSTSNASSQSVALSLPLLGGDNDDNDCDCDYDDEADRQGKPQLQVEATTKLLGAVKEAAASEPRFDPNLCSPNESINVARTEIGGNGTHADSVAQSPWLCPRCTLANPRRYRRCGACSERRPVLGADETAFSSRNGLMSPSSRKRRRSLPPPTSGTDQASSHSKGRRSAKSTPLERRSARKNKARLTQEPLACDREPATSYVDNSSPSALCGKTGAPVMDNVANRSTATTSVESAGTTTTIRVSTSPFESVLPVPVTSVARSTRAPDVSSVAPPTASSTSIIMAPQASTTSPCDPYAAGVPAAFLQQLQDRFEMENRWFQGRISEGERAVELRSRELKHAEAELLRAQDEWRAFKVEYYAFRSRQPPASPSSITGSTPADSSRDRRTILQAINLAGPCKAPATCESMTSELAAKEALAGDSPGAQSPLCQNVESALECDPPSIHHEPFLPPSAKHEVHRSDLPPPTLDHHEYLESPSAANTTSQVLEIAASKLQKSTPSWQARFLRRSLSQSSSSQYVAGGAEPPPESPAVADSQATIDPDLDPRYASFRNRRYPTLSFYPPMAERNSNGSIDHPYHAGEEELPNSELTFSQDSRKDGVGAFDSTLLPPAQLPGSSSAQGKPHPLSASTNRVTSSSSSNVGANMSGWDSTKASRDFVAQRVHPPSATRHTYDSNGHGTASSEAAGVAATTGEWVKAAKRARQNQRDRTKALYDALWDDDASQDQQPRKPRPDDEPKYAYQEVVRCKALRQELPCHDCYSCRAFYAALPTEDALALLRHSRHRAQHSPSETPQDFWVSDFIDEVEKEREEELSRQRESAQQQK